jgi:hypothetical protein
MKPLSIILPVILIILNSNSYGQTNQADYLVIENNFPGKTEFEKSVKGSENIYFNKSEIPVIYQLDSLLEGENINNLHLYLNTKPGEINFGKIILTPQNLSEYSDRLKGLKKLVSGRVIIHNNLVFTEEKGALLKQMLEEISGLHFETR